MKKRRIIAILLSLAMILTFMPAIAFAGEPADPVARIGDNDYDTLEDAYEAANPGDTITMLKDVTLGNTLEVKKNVTIDLSENGISGSVSPVIKVQDSSLTINGETTGSIEGLAGGTAVYAYGTGAIILEGGLLVSTLIPLRGFDTTTSITVNGGRVEGSTGIQTYGDVTVQGGTIAGGDGGIGISQLTAGEKVNVSGGTVSGGKYGIKTTAGTVTVSGSAEISGGTAGLFSNSGNTTGGFVVEDDARVFSTSDTGCGIHVASVPLTINGGDISGNYGIEIENASKTSPINVTITGGIISGKQQGIYIKNSKYEIDHKVIISGAPTVIGGNAYDVIDWDKTEQKNYVTVSISGGVFSSDVENYVATAATPCVTIKRDSDTLYAVGDATEDAIEDGDKVTVTKATPDGDVGSFSTDKNVVVENGTTAALFVNGTLIKVGGKVNSKEASAISDKENKLIDAEAAYEAAREAGDVDKTLEAAKAYKAAADAFKSAVDKQDGVADGVKDNADMMAHIAARELTAAQNAANDTAKKSAAASTAATAAAQEAALQGVLDTNLPNVKAKRVAKVKKTNVTAKWKKVSKKNKKKIDGVEIWVSADPSFTTGRIIKTAGKAKVSKKVSGLTSKTTYYVKVRSYKNVGGTKHVGNWSKVKKVTTK